MDIATLDPELDAASSWWHHQHQRTVLKAEYGDMSTWNKVEMLNELLEVSTFPHICDLCICA